MRDGNSGVGRAIGKERSGGGMDSFLKVVGIYG